MRFKRLLFIVCMLVSIAAIAGNGVEIKTVVLDAGHGGKDPGASGPGKTNEKDVALAVAIKLGDLIKKNFPEVNVIYTRKTDVFVELHERAEMANKAKADLFIAIHCNSNPNGQAYGTSTYVLGLHRTEANLEVAKRENSVILLESDHDKNYEFDPNSPEGNIIMSMKQNAFLDQSIDIASKIENQYETGAKRKSLGVKQAGFYVLYKTTMPSILSEIGFISNPEEEKFLNSGKGQEQIATSLLKAFKDYKYEMENRQPEQEEIAKVDATAISKPVETEAAKKEATITTPPVAKKDTIAKQPVAQNNDTEANTEVTTLSGRRIKKPIENSSGGGVAAGTENATIPDKTTAQETAATTKPVATSNAVTTEKRKETNTDTTSINKPVAVNKPVVVKKDTVAKTVSQPITSTKPVAEDKTADAQQTKDEVIKENKEVTTVKKVEKAPAKPVETIKPPVETLKPAPTKTETAAHTSASGLIFKVQLFAIKGEPKKAEGDKINRLFTVSTEELDGGIIRYFAGNEKSYLGVKKVHEAAVNAGYKDAFIVGYKDGKRMSPNELKAAEAK